MRSRTRLTLTPLLLATALLSTGCAQRAASPSLHLTEGDRLPLPDTPRPQFATLKPPAASGVAERNYLLDTVIRPLLRFSVAQEETTAAERQRADAVVAKVDALDAATQAANKPWWRFW